MPHPRHFRQTGASDVAGQRSNLSLRSAGATKTRKNQEWPFAEVLQCTCGAAPLALPRRRCPRAAHDTTERVSVRPSGNLSGVISCNNSVSAVLYILETRRGGSITKKSRVAICRSFAPRAVARGQRTVAPFTGAVGPMARWSSSGPSAPSQSRASCRRGETWWCATGCSWRRLRRRTCSVAKCYRTRETGFAAAAASSAGPKAEGCATVCVREGQGCARQCMILGGL